MKDLTSTDLSALLGLSPPETENAAPAGTGSGVQSSAALKIACEEDTEPASENQGWAALDAAPQWCAWREERRGESWTKVPYSSAQRMARANDPATWLTRTRADAVAADLPAERLKGVGLFLGGAGDLCLGGIDLDSCLGLLGDLEPWAAEVLARFASYAEVSPSGTGAKVFFAYRAADLEPLRAIMGTKWSKSFSRGSHHEIALHLGNRYFTVTGQRLDSAPATIETVDRAALEWLITDAGPRFKGEEPATAPKDDSRSGRAFRIAGECRRAGLLDENQNDSVQHRAEIRTICRAAGLPAEFADALIDADASVTEARAAAFDEIQKRGRTVPTIRVTGSNDDPAQIQTRAADALAFRMAGGELPDASREFVGMSLRDLAAESLTRSGVSTRGMSADEVFHRSLGTSDFPLVVSNAMGKVAAQAYKAAESPLKALARQRTLPNFKTSTSIRIGEMGRLEEMTEHGEFTHTNRAEAGETMALKTFGSAINVSRKLLIDDDLGLLGDMTAAMGQAAAQTEAEEMVALFTGNPNLSDGTAVFHASRGNTVAGALPVLSEAALTAARKHMRTVKGLDGKTIINAVPKYLVVSPDLETDAEKLLATIYAATTDDVQPIKLTLVVEPRLTGDAWYLLADPASVPSIQYAYLSAAQGVQIQRQEAWDTLGLKYRAFLDFGCGWLDWRGAFRSEES